MNNLYKKISAIALSGMIIAGGCLSSVNAYDFSGYRQVYSINDFIKRNGFRIFLKEESEQKINHKIDSIVKNYNLQPQVRKRLLQLADKPAVKIKSIDIIKSLLKSGKQLHKIEVEKSYYLVGLDEVSFHAGSRESERKFYNVDNQRNYDIIEFYKRRYQYDIILVEDISSYALSVKMEASIRSIFKGKPDVREKLLKQVDKKFKNVESLRLSLKSGNKFFKNLKKGQYYRVQVDNLEYVLLKK